ncbi:MAG TPA: zinc ribbon domain-containing protein [Vicinamibacterales bacterium]|jgi:hypothetical protein
MSSMVCSKCGTSLAAGAKSCPSCGQAIAAPPSAAAKAKSLPMAAVVGLVGGLVVLLGAVTLYRSGVLSGPSSPTTPVAATQAAQPAPPTGASTPSAPGSTAAPGAMAAAGATASTPPAAQPALGAAPSAPGAAPAPAIPGTPPAVALPAKPAPPPPPPFEKTYECREYAVFDVSPETTIVTVDGELIGIVDEWDDAGGGKKYEFKREGVHYVKLSHRDYKTVWLRFIVSKKAEHKTADVELELKKKKD